MFTHDSQEKVIQLLIKEGLVFESDVKRVVEEAEKRKQPLLANLVAQKICDAETISHARGEKRNSLCGDVGRFECAAD